MPKWYKDRAFVMLLFIDVQILAILVVSYLILDFPILIGITSAISMTAGYLTGSFVGIMQRGKLYKRVKKESLKECKEYLAEELKKQRGLPK